MTFLELVLLFSLTLLGISMILSLIRLIIGPTFPDRIVALEMITFLILGIVACFSVYTGETSYLDIAIIISLISFLTTIAFAYYIEKRVQR